jgi:hypothetical protein
MGDEMPIRVTLLLLILTTPAAFAQELPTIHLLYQSPGGSIFDRNCSQITKTEIKREWVQETVRRRAEFQSWWDKDGPQYLRTVLKEIGRPFPYRAMQATLTVCPAVGSMGEPMFITVREFLSDASNPPPNWMFAVYLFHELMHQYVRPVLESSPLRKKYASEPQVVQLHLHVMALVRFALIKSGKDVELKYVDAQARGVNRAWEIVNDIEGHEVFLNELKALPKSAFTPN